jgi:hypothetical protein
VIRSVLLLGYTLPAEQLDALATKLLATRNVDDLMLGIELAAFSTNEEVRKDAGRRITRLIMNMDDAVTVLLAPRLLRVLDLPPPPADRTPKANDFRALLAQHGGNIRLPSKLPGQAPPPPGMRSPLADMSIQQFARLRDYLGALRQRDLDLVLVIDATASMTSIINEARAGADALILYMSELSRTMRLACIVYRDYDSGPVWEGERFTDNISTIREFLFKVRLVGGADFPEAVYEGVAACRDLNWRKNSTRMIVIIGDAPPHQRDISKLSRELEWHEQRGNVVHTLFTPHRTPGRPLSAYDESTRQVFEQIASKTRGRSDIIDKAAELVPAIMHCTIEPQWRETFDEFYRLYLELCR